jgi:hypothetical protein
VYEQIAGQLAAAGFRVERLPILHGERLDEARRGVVLNWNNVVTLDTAEGRQVFVPRYGVPALDRLAHEAWARWGFAVRPIHVRGTVVYGGAVRCVVNVLEQPGTRTPPRG